MPILDPSGAPIRKISDDQIISAINTIGRRNQTQQLQIMQLGLLIEFLIEKLGATSIQGEPVFVIDEQEFDNFSKRRYEEIKVEAQEFASAVQENGQAPDVDLSE